MRIVWTGICGLLSVVLVVFLVAGCAKKQDKAGSVKKLEIYYQATPHVACFYKGLFKQLLFHLASS